MKTERRFEAYDAAFGAVVEEVTLRVDHPKREGEPAWRLLQAEAILPSSEWGYSLTTSMVEMMVEEMVETEEVTEAVVMAEAEIEAVVMVAEEKKMVEVRVVMVVAEVVE